MRSIANVMFVCAITSVLAACAGNSANSADQQSPNSAQAQPTTKTAQGCSPGEMVSMAGSRIKQPCGSQPVQSGATMAGAGGW